MKRMATALSRALVRLASRLARLLPKRYQSSAKTTGKVMLAVPAVVRGIAFGQRFESEDGTQATADRPQAHRVVHASNPLEAYFDSHREGQGIWKWRHYFEIYHRHFAKFVGREVHVLEIGVYSGGSLPMWKDYFGSQCRVYGVDIQEACKSYEDESVQILIGDQSDRSFWKRVRESVPALDIVIDDGGHLPEQQIVSLEELLPHLRPGGVYLCEDVYTVFNPFHDYLSGVTHLLNAWDLKPGVSRPHEGILPNPFQRAVHSVHLYPYAVVVEKREVPASEFVAPRHGTQWQPWL